MENEYAWVTSKYQIEGYESPNINDELLRKKDSQIYKRITDKSCEAIENFNQDLNNGQDCEDNRNCKSATCTSQNTGQPFLCTGLVEGKSCNKAY